MTYCADVKELIGGDRSNALLSLCNTATLPNTSTPFDTTATVLPARMRNQQLQATYKLSIALLLNFPTSLGPLIRSNCTSSSPRTIIPRQSAGASPASKGGASVSR